MSSTHVPVSHAVTLDVAELLEQARNGDPTPLGTLLELYRNYLTILATAEFNRKLSRRLNPSDLVQEAMLAAHRDFAQFRGDSEGEFLAWLRQILIHCLHRAIEVHFKAKKRDMRCEVSIEQVNAALDRSAVDFANVLADPDRHPAQRRGNRNARWLWRMAWQGSKQTTAK